MRQIKAVFSSPGAWILSLWALAVASRCIKSGWMFGLNYSLFQPDGELYLQLARQAPTGDFSTIPAVTWTRPLYPLLSAPFVAAFGDQGMLVLPALSLLLVGWVVLRVGQAEGSPWLAVVIFAALSCSITVTRWVVADLTDAPHLAVFALACLALYRNSSPKWLLLLLILGLTARPSGPVWVALLAPFAFRATGSSRLWLVGGGAIAFVATIAADRYTQAAALAAGDGTPVFEQLQRIAMIPIRFLSVNAVELGQLAVLDRLLLAFVVGAVVLAVRGRHEVWSQAFLSVLMMTSVLDAWVGEYGVNFRYQLPALIPAAIVCLRSISPELPRLRQLQRPTLGRQG